MLTIERAKMSSVDTNENGKNVNCKVKDIEQIEDILPLPSNERSRVGYRPSTLDEARLDRSINWKMDCIVVFVLAAGFLVSQPSHEVMFRF